MAIGKKTGGGSRKGRPNKATAELKAMIEGALTSVGGQKYLEQQAIENPTAFLSLIGKILPRDVNVGGQKDNPITVSTESVREQLVSIVNAIAAKKI